MSARLPAALALGLLALAPSCMHDGATPTAATARAEAVDALAFSDANIAAVLRAVNLMEIRPSQIAVERAQSTLVRDFARKMVGEHANVDQRMQQLLADQGLRLVDNAFSHQLTLNLDPTLAELQQVDEAAFDVAFILQQISAHRLALHSLDTNLVPSASDPELRAFLTNEVRPAIEQHYEEILRIHSLLIGVGS